MTGSMQAAWVTRERYLSALQDLPNASLYHQPAWLDAVAQGFAAQQRFACCTDAGGVVAVAPFMVKRKGPFRLLGSPLSGLYTEFTGPLLRPGLEPQARDAAVDALHRLAARGAHYVEWGGMGEPDWGATLDRIGLQRQQRPTLLVDLSAGERAAWAALESRARNMVRKAEKAGVAVCVVMPDATWIDSYYAMLEATFRRQGMATPHPASFYRQIIPLSRQGMARCLTATFEGAMVAACIFVIDRDRMLYLSGVANEAGMKTAATSVLQWRAIQEAIALGIAHYDMGGLGVASIDKFKRSFGGTDTSHTRWTHRSALFSAIEPAARWAARRGWMRLGGT